MTDGCAAAVYAKISAGYPLDWGAVLSFAAYQGLVIGNPERHRWLVSCQGSVELGFASSYKCIGSNM